ncbi:hypothetical protein BZARG_1699 [Bizionia argentinensis JUB59]|uniref:Uncharacterized protein n=1 Tax=Bizionia argentinensis JUB59 TaxID=1046627 RepID=G2EEY5_9FLAO|nr:hypothetical protein [Bizionia argentinensis]EGV42987.1 hypothetical protein BZARG_1699 [Bizionia argentinensis JUB59]
MMKNVFFALALMLASTFASANNKTNSDLSSTEIVSSNEIELTLNLGDITNKSVTEINQEVQDFIITNLKSVDALLDCTITVTGSVNVGVASVEISVAVSGSCGEVMVKGAEIANIVLEKIKNALSN